MKKLLLVFVLALFVWQTAISLKRPKFSVNEIFDASDTTGIKFDGYKYLNDTTVALYYFFEEEIDSVLVAVSNVRGSVVFRYLNGKWNFSVERASVMEGYCELFEDDYSKETYLFPENQDPDTLLKYFGLSSFNPVIASEFITLTAEEINSMGVESIYKSVHEDLLIYDSESSVNISISSVPELSEYFEFLKTKNKFEIAARKDSVIRLLQQTRINYKAAYFNYLNTVFKVSGISYALLDEYNFDNQLIKIHLFLDDKVDGVYVATIVSKLKLSLAEKLFDSELVDGEVYFYVSQDYGNKSLGVTEDGETKWIMPDLYSKQKPAIFIGNEKIKISFKADELTGQLWPDSINTDDWEQNENYKPFEDNVRIIFGEVSEITEFNLSPADSVVAVDTIAESEIEYGKKVDIQAPVVVGTTYSEYDSDIPFVVVEAMPSYPGGEGALMKYLAENIKYPVIAQSIGIHGRVISNMPRWTPGKQKGKTVRVKYTMPVNFRLQ